MKRIILLITLNAVFSIQGYADNLESKLADAINVICQMENEHISFDEREDCMLYYTNCMVNSGSRQINDQLMKCAEERNK